MLIVVALLNLLTTTTTPGSWASDRRTRNAVAGFAAPDALAGLVPTPTRTSLRTTARARGTHVPKTRSGLPPARSKPAGAIRVCDLFDKPLAISFWFTRGGDCTPTQDAFDEVAGRFRDRVNFLSVNVRDDPGTVADIVRQHGWTVPVALDRDGAVSNLYRVGVCPTIVLAYPGGVLYDADIGNDSADQLTDLVSGSSLRRASAPRRSAEMDDRPFGGRST